MNLDISDFLKDIFSVLRLNLVWMEAFCFISILLKSWRYVLKPNLLSFEFTAEISAIVILFTTFFPPFSHVLEKDTRSFFEMSTVHWPFPTCSAFKCSRLSLSWLIYDLCVFLDKCVSTPYTHTKKPSGFTYHSQVTLVPWYTSAG